MSVIDLSPSFSELHTELVSSAFEDVVVDKGDVVRDDVVDDDVGSSDVLSVFDASVLGADIDAALLSSSLLRDESFKMDAPAGFGLLEGTPRLALKLNPNLPIAYSRKWTYSMEILVLLKSPFHNCVNWSHFKFKSN